MRIEEGVYVHKSNYHNTHGKNPSGHGSWAFAHTNNPKPEHIFWHHGKFGEAQKAAIAHAKQRGHSEIHVLTESTEENTMNEDFAPIADVITLVANDQHAEASSIVNDLLSARVLDSLQAHKETIAQSLFAPSADSLSEEAEQLDEISLKTKFSAYKKASEDEESGQPKEQARSQSLTARIEKDVEKKYGSKMVGHLERAASVSHYGRAALKEEIVQEEHESVEEFKARGGKVTQAPAGKAYGSQKPQTIKKAKQYFVKKG